MDRVLTLPHIAGMKVTDHDLFQLGLMQAHAGDRLIFFSGADELMCHAALCGVVGAIGSFYNLWGPACMAARQAFVTGSFEAGRRFMLGFQAASGEILGRQSAWTFLRAAMPMKHGIDIGPTRGAAGYRRSTLERGRRRTVNRTGRGQCTRRSLIMGLHRVLVIGVGSIGERHLRCFQATGRAEVSFVEINGDLRRSVADRYGIHAAHADLETGLAERPDVAVIATPAPLHVPMATRLAEANIPMLIEKPLSTRLDGIDRLRDLVDQRQIVASVGYVYRVHPVLTAMKEALDADRFGRAVQIVSTSGQHFPTYRPAYRSIYYADRAQGGGAIQDAITHMINAGEWLVGPVNRVVVDAAHQVLEGVNVEDTVHLLARHGSVLGSYSLNQYQSPDENTLTVVCERGTIRGEFHESRWRWMKKPGDRWHDEPIAPFERDALYIAQAERFLDAAQGNAAVPCSLEDGLQTLRVNLAALASLETRTWQTLPSH